ncbi:hypothetical protein ACET3Z_028905 [Daucus carota]
MRRSQDKQLTQASGAITRMRDRSPKDKGEPLLKKDYGEGGNDVDRRQIISSDASFSLWVFNHYSSYVIGTCCCFRVGLSRIQICEKLCSVVMDEVALHFFKREANG